METQGVGTGYQFWSVDNEELTEEEKATLEEILAKYDPENLSEEDRKNLMEDLKEAGIPRCRATMQVLQENGFQPPKKGEGEGEHENQGLAIGRNPLLTQLIAQFRSGEISQEEFQDLINQMVSQGETASGNIIDESV